MITGLSAGGIAGSNAGTIKDSYTTTPVAGTGANASIGGICGTNTGTIEHCYAVGKITGTAANNNAGGISGTNAGTITNSLALNKEGITGTSQGRITGTNTGTLASNDASPLIPGTWTDADTGKDGDEWDGKSYRFPTWLTTKSTTNKWDTSEIDLLPHLQTFISQKTDQPAIALRRAAYGAYTFELSEQPGGTVGFTDPGNKLPKGKYPGLTIFKLSHELKPGYIFKTYTADGLEFEGNEHELVDDVIISAVFVPVYTVTITQPAPAEGSFTASYSSTTLSDGENADIPQGTVLTLKATPAPGYELETFTADETPFAGNTYTVNSDITLSAKFKQKPAPPVGPPSYHTVILPAVTGATTDPVAGEYEVESWSSFRFYLTLDKAYDKSEPVVTTSLGETILPRTSDGAYIVKHVRQPVEILIDGIVKNSDAVGNETIQTNAIKVWATKGNLHINTQTEQTVQVYSLNGSLIKQAGIPAGDTLWQLPSGIYIVRADNRQFKIIL